MPIAEERHRADERLRELGLELPEVPRPIANFVPWKRNGNTIYLAGQTCEWNGSVVYQGKLGAEYDLEAGEKAARICALNLIAALRDCLGGTLSPVRSCLRLGGFVNCVPDYEHVPHVIDGASNLMIDLFGKESGMHARTAVGVSNLPQGAAVEVDAWFAIG